MRKINYKTVKWKAVANFDGSVINAKNGPGKFNFDDLEKQACAAGLQGVVRPVFSLSFSATAGRTLVDVYLRNPVDPLDRKVLYHRAEAEGDDPVTSFTSDNCCCGWDVPYIEDNCGNRYELILVTEGVNDDDDIYALLETWFEPTPNLTLYRSMLLREGAPIG